MTTTMVYANTLTMLNTDLLLTSGVVSISAVHACTMKTMVSTHLLLLVVVILGLVFLMVQCVEYLHLYWCMYSYDAPSHQRWYSLPEHNHYRLVPLPVLPHQMRRSCTGPWYGYTYHGLCTHAASTYHHPIQAAGGERVALCTACSYHSDVLCTHSVVGMLVSRGAARAHLSTDRMTCRISGST